MRNRPPGLRSCSGSGLNTSRRGVMLVAVTLLVLMMTVIVTIFSAATGALNGLQATHQLDGDLRQVDITIRRDLQGVTAKLSPPLNPKDERGYFEVGENAFADLQNEDTDDYLRFTAKAPEGQLFTGYAWFGASGNSPNQPVRIASQYAEIIYFLRNGNLYRRVLLVAPERQSAINDAWANAGGNTSSGTRAVFFPDSLNKVGVSWQGVNSISAHPSPVGSALNTTNGQAMFPIKLNTLGDLTNRENRWPAPRFASDYLDLAASGMPDGIPDDNNPNTAGEIVGDGVPDYWPTLYSNMPFGILLNDATDAKRLVSSESMAFPYVYPGAYSRPDATSGSLAGYGWIHSLDPSFPDPDNPPNPAVTLDQLRKLNHSPLELGDSLPIPAGTSTQTWWGFPTWRETLLTRWTDPTLQLQVGNTQPFGLHPQAADARPGLASLSLPPMTETYRVTPQLLNDGLGLALPAADTVVTASGTVTVAPRALWQSSWDDDMIMTNVRSFDIKVFDNAFPGYVDLGWGDDVRLQPPSIPSGAATSFLAQANGPQFQTRTLATTYWTSGTWDTLTQTFAHEGRMPPLVTDNRYDAQFGQVPAGTYTSTTRPSFASYTGNVGDANAKVMRLRRVWDTWSTDYTTAPANGFDPDTKLPYGPPVSPPIYPSYPAPYPVPLRGIQIQIRVADPRNERVRSITIRHDFSDKL